MAVVILATGAALVPAIALGGSTARKGAQCHSAQLRLVASFYGEAGGQFVQTLTFANVSQVSCDLAGWPSVKPSLGTGAATYVRTTRVVQGSPKARPYRTVILQARGGRASFDLFGSDFNFTADRPCPKTTALLVTPPRASPIRVRVVVPNCGSFDVAPVVAGKNDRNSWSVVWHG